MIEYIKGTLEDLTPTDAVVECHGIGYRILISLQTFSQLENRKEVTVYIHHYLREDEELFYGFGTKDERELFRLLIGVSGIGAATARMMLSSLTSDEIRNAIIAEDINRIKSIKGIGLKSAQRLILELKDKLMKTALPQTSGKLIPPSQSFEDTRAILLSLGYEENEIEDTLSKILPTIEDNSNSEEVIRKALTCLSM